MRISRMMKLGKQLAGMTPVRNNGFNLGHRVALLKGASANPKGNLAEEARHENPYESYPGSCEYLPCTAR